MLRHPLHPALVHFPIGLLLSATITDLVSLIGLWSDPHFAALLLAAGLVAGLAAIIAGLWDFMKLDETLVRPAMMHMSVVGIAWLGYALALYLRRDAMGGTASASTVSVAISIVSGAVLAFGSWLGGNLVYRYGAGRTLE